MVRKLSHKQIRKIKAMDFSPKKDYTPSEIKNLAKLNKMKYVKRDGKFVLVS